MAFTPIFLFGLQESTQYIMPHEEQTVLFNIVTNCDAARHRLVKLICHAPCSRINLP